MAQAPRLFWLLFRLFNQIGMEEAVQIRKTLA
jgi:hypothetical protein